MKDLIPKYTEKIKSLKKERDAFEKKGSAGACIAITGEISAYEEVIKDLEKL